MLVGDLNTVHTLATSVEPDGTLVLCAERSKRHSVSSLDSNTSVVRATPAASTRSGRLDFTVVVDVLERVTKVALGPSGIVGDDDVRAVHTGGLGVDEITVHVRGHGQSSIVLLDALASSDCRSTKSCGPLWLSGTSGEAVQLGDGSASRGSGGHASSGRVGQDSKSIVVCNKTSGFAGVCNGHSRANSSKSGWVDLLDVNTTLRVVQVGNPSLGSIWGDLLSISVHLNRRYAHRLSYSKRSTPVLRTAGPVSLLDRVELAGELKRVWEGLERAVAQRSERASGKGEKKGVRQHADL